MRHDPTPKSEVITEPRVSTISGGQPQTQTGSESQGDTLEHSPVDQPATARPVPGITASSSAALSVQPDSCQEPGPKQPPQKLRVLLVDDDASVRRLIRMALDAAGFEVLEAADGTVAMQLCEQTEVIHIVLADVLMPKLSGRQLASHVVTHHPEARVLLMSGYPNVTGFLDGVVGRAEKTRTEFGFIQKPFGPAQLIQKIGEMIRR